MWIKSKRPPKSAFKLPGAAELFGLYVDRLKAYCDAEVVQTDAAQLASRGPGEKLWLCERIKGRPTLRSSEEVAQELQSCRLAGVKKIWVVIGPPDGISAEEMTRIRPDVIWSFGPATYPHELATVMMSEQLYRGWTILAGHPYHLGH